MKNSKAISLILSSAMAVSMLSGCVITEPVVEMPQTSETTGFDVSEITAADDFYGYINAQYLLESDLDPFMGSTGSFDAVQNMVDDQLEGAIREIANGDRNSYLPGSNEQLIYDAYYQVLDYSCGNVDISDEISDTIMERVNLIDSSESYDELFDIIKTISNMDGVNLLWETRVSVASDDSTQYVIYLYPSTMGMMKDFEDISQGLYSAENLKEQIKATLYYTGVDYEEAVQRAVDITYLLIDISGETNYDALDFDTYNSYIEYVSEDELSSELTNMDLEDFYKTLGIDENPTGRIAVLDMNQLIFIDSLMTDENLRAFKDLVIHNYVESFATFLPEEMGGSLILYTDDSAAIAAITSYFPTQVGEIYAERFIDENAVAEVTEITNDMVDEYINLINECTWMEDETKAAIIGKLNSMEYFIGAGEPHVINSEDEAIIGENFFETLTNINRVNIRQQIDLLSNPVERNGFINMPPHIVNACYDPNLNCINITGAIMNYPFYDGARSYAANLGGIGAVIGHEISHAFDSYGMNFDSNGNYNPGWICDDDRNDFENLRETFINYYSDFTVMEVYHVDGELTLSENMADASAVQCGLNLVTTDEERRDLLESYARIWASVTPEDMAMMALEYDEHSPDRIRVNAVVSMFDCFYDLYDVNEGDAMYIAPEDRVQRW